MEHTPLYPRKLNPVPTPAEREQLLEIENATLRMRVAVLTEALRAAEEELTKHHFGECEWASGGVTLPHAVVQGVFNKREWPE
jgi:hypothetical protein